MPSLGPGCPSPAPATILVGGEVPLTPEQQAREVIDKALAEAGWIVQLNSAVNLSAGRGVAVCEAALAKGHGHADYLLFVDGKAAGIIEAKKPGIPLTGVEVQAEKIGRAHV